MPISEKSRSALYQSLAPIAGEEAVGEMLSYFPARHVEEPVTEESLRAEIAGVRTQIADVGIEIAELRKEMHTLHNRLLVQLSATMIASIGIATSVVVALVH